jgi:hypothetical protein
MSSQKLARPCRCWAPLVVPFWSKESVSFARRSTDPICRCNSPLSRRRAELVTQAAEALTHDAVSAISRALMRLSLRFDGYRASAFAMPAYSD